MARYYAYISGGTHIPVPVNPSSIYSGYSNHLTLEFNGDNLRTDSTRNNAAVWIRTSGNWFSFEMYGQGWEYLNLGSTTYIGRYDYWSTTGFDSTFVIDIDNGNVTLTKGQQTSATTFDGGITASDMIFFRDTSGRNCLLNFYRLGIYGYSGGQKTLLYDFVPDLSGSTKGLRDKVSGEFYAATYQDKITLYQLSGIDIDPSAITASYTSGSTAVTVDTGGDTGVTWSATTSNSWITLTNPTGSGDGSVTVAYTDNSSYQNRTGTVTFTSSESDELTLTITQGKHPILVPKNNIYREGNLIN